MIKFHEFIKEHKFWGKTILELLEWIKDKSDKYWILIDTESSGLLSDPYEIQLTQISSIVIKYNFNSNSFEEIDSFNKKLKLTKSTLDLMKNPNSRIKSVLSFNHYGQKGQFHDEEETIKDFFDFINQYPFSIFIIQNAEFDMRFLNTRNKNIKFKNEVIDTKQLLQLFYLPALQKLSESDPNYKNLVDKIGKSDRDNGLISSSLSKVGPAMGINMSGYHDALTDCRLMMQMFINMMNFFKEHQDIDIRKYQTERIKTKK